jgi:hypothetical protein
VRRPDGVISKKPEVIRTMLQNRVVSDLAYLLTSRATRAIWEISELEIVCPGALAAGHIVFGWVSAGVVAVQQGASCLIRIPCSVFLFPCSVFLFLT